MTAQPIEDRAVAADTLTIGQMLAVIEKVDAHLDANTAQAYRDQPLAGHWSRITKVIDEAVEAKDALAGVTGENPRKGVCDTWEHVMEELGDAWCASMFGIQHITKNIYLTAAVLAAAMEKARARAAAAPGEASNGIARNLREEFGVIVRATFVDWALGQPDAKPSWLIPWGPDLDPGQKEVDMRIGEAVAQAAVKRAGIDLDAARMELDRLRAENAELRAALAAPR